MKKETATATIKPRLLTTEQLKVLLSCGREQAVQFGDKAGARVQLGRLMRWDNMKIEKAIDENITTEIIRR